MSWARDLETMGKITRNLRDKGYKVDKLYNQAVDERWTLERFKREALDEAGIETLRPPPTLPPELTIGYSTSRAIKCALDGVWNGQEGEAARELMKKFTYTPCGGIPVPFEAIWGTRNFDSGTDTLGAFLVTQGVYGYSPAFHAKAICAKLGAQVLQLNNPASIPRLAEGGTGNWVGGATVASTLSTGNFTSVTLQPHPVTAYQQYEAQLLFSSSPNASIDRIVSNDIASIIGAEVDRVALQGAGGESAEPLGILGTAGVNSVVLGANGLDILQSTLALPFCASLEEAIATDNANDQAIAFVAAPQERRKLRSTQSFTDGGPPVWGNDNRVLGHPAEISTQLSRALSTGTATTCCSYIMAVDFSDLLIGHFANGITEITVDRTTGAASGLIRLYARAYFDCALRRPQSACLGGGILS